MSRSTPYIDNAVKLIAPLLTFAGIIIGLWQFNKGQMSLQKKEFEQRQFELDKMLIGNQFEAISNFKKLQSEKYSEAAEIISGIIYTDNYQSPEFKEKLKRFWQLYWVELSAVEDSQVETAMISLGAFITKLEKQQFKQLTDDDKTKLFNLGYSVAQAIKKSSKVWELPKGIER